MAPGPDVEPPTIVAVETQRCRQPNRFHGVGVVVGDDLVLTAGHTVEGDLRELTVEIDRHVTLVVEHATDRRRTAVTSVIFSPGVADGEIVVPCRRPAANDLTWPDPSNTC